jgi:hypothetical protein
VRIRREDPGLGLGADAMDKALDWLARVIELALAFAFIVAVLLNFTNVVGRYLFGLSLLGSDEVPGFIISHSANGARLASRQHAADLFNP